jgi:hypothetical protein
VHDNKNGKCKGEDNSNRKYNRRSLRDDNKKGNSNSRSPSGMTTRKAKATAPAGYRDRIEVEERCCYGMYPSEPDSEGEAVGEGL